MRGNDCVVCTASFLFYGGLLVSLQGESHAGYDSVRGLWFESLDTFQFLVCGLCR